MARRIYLSSPALNGTEMSYVQEAFDSNWVAPVGRHLEAFEAEVAAYVGVKQAVALSSGTAALHLALKAVGVAEGDIVLCSDLTLAASCNPIKYEKAEPVFIDSEKESWNLDPRLVEKALREYPRAKALVAVNLYGTPAKLAEIADLCATHNLALIEDAAESLGASVSGRQTGTFGRLGVFSFNGNKIITTSGGGMLVSDEENLINLARFWATQARDQAPHYQHSHLGYNYRLSNICAGIGRGQLTTLNLRLKQKEQIYDRYRQALAAQPQIDLNPIPAPPVHSNHWLTCLTLAPETPVKPSDIMAALEKENIESRPIWKPMSLQPYYQGCDFLTFGRRSASVSSDIFARGLCLPSDVSLSPAEQARVCDLILSLF